MLRKFLNLMFDVNERPAVVDGEVVAVYSAPLRVRRGAEDSRGPRPELDWMMGVD